MVKKSGHAPTTWFFYSSQKIVTICVLLIAFCFPIEHKYDKWFRSYSLTLIPSNLNISAAYNKKLYFYLSDFITLFLCFFSRYFLGISWKRLFFHPLSAIFLLALLSIIASPFRSYPVAYSRLLQFASPILLFSIITQVYAPATRQRITRIILLAIVSMGTLQSLVGTLQYFRNAPLGLRLLGETKQKPVIYVEGGKKWTFDYSASETKLLPVLRAYGTFPNANILGGFLVFSILGCYQIWAESYKRGWWIGFLLPLQIFALFLTYSRAALLGMLLASVLWGYSVFRNKLCPHWRQILVYAMLSCLISIFLLHKQLYRRGGIINTTTISQRSNEGRMELIKVGFRVVTHHPLLGLGLGQFSERAVPYFKEESSPSLKATAPHNIFLFLACEIGLPALIIFGYFLISLVRSYWSSPSSLELATFFSLFISYLLIGSCDFYPILSQQGRVIFFLILAQLSLHSLQLNCPNKKLILRLK